jgi:hypothetical protein
MSFEVLDACESRGEQASGMDWPTKQSFYNKLILDLIKAQVCSLVYKFGVYFHSAPEVEGDWL